MSKDIFLVIGGSGFLGRHIVELLKDRGDEVSVLDVVQRYHDVPFFSGDITDLEQVADALQKSGATCIIHTASPVHGLGDPSLYFKVNVDGTRTLLQAAGLTSNNVHKFVYTSSAGVVFNGENLIGVDERQPYAEPAMDAYNESKARAEQLVLESNGNNGVWTVALRPAGIFGPGDRQMLAGLVETFENSNSHFQIGDNTNLFDFTYVTNVARAHLLAADRLGPPAFVHVKTHTNGLESEVETFVPTEEETEMLDRPLPPINLTTGDHRVPTSAARPLGPYVTLPPDAETLVSAFEKSDYDPRPVIRSRFDPLSNDSLARLPADANPLSVAGQAFFITNGEPVYMWDFMRYVWHALHEATGKPERRLVVFSRSVGILFAHGAQWWGWLRGKEHPFSPYRVRLTCAVRWHNIEKARRVLGYEPEVGLEEGLKRSIEWLLKERGLQK